MPTPADFADLRTRLAALRRFRLDLAESLDEVAALVHGPNRRVADTIAAEMLPPPPVPRPTRCGWSRRGRFQRRCRPDRPAGSNRC